MSDAKDPAIKLFGRTIQLAPNDDVSGEADCEQSCCDHSNNNNNNNNCLSCSNGSVSPSCLFDKSSTAGEGSTDSKLEDGSSSAGLEEQTAGEDKQSSSPKASKKDEESEKSSKSQDKPLKKPDKILPCPRCNSTDTKFCYFNNYNVNQPRYFCKNCQRYWTAGGTMRNVPVGAGRRKNKHSSSNPRYIVIPDTPNGMIYPALRGNAFGSEAPLCESMTSSLTIAESSSNTSSNPTGEGGNPVTQEPSTSGIQSFGPQVPCYPAPPWPSPWNPAQWSSPVPPYPFPVPIFATPPYWNCGVPAAWSTPWMHPADVSSPSLSPNSPLGKHPREGGTPKSSNKEQHGEDHRAETKVLTPKILRIDDPSEAAKSSIWTTLGIKHGNTSSLDSGVFFRGLQAKGGPICSAPEASSVLQANPAALSRSLTYHETAE